MESMVGTSVQQDGAAQVPGLVLRRLGPGGEVILCGPTDRQDGGWRRWIELMQRHRETFDCLGEAEEVTDTDALQQGLTIYSTYLRAVLIRAGTRRAGPAPRV